MAWCLCEKRKRTIRSSCQPRLVPGQNSVKAVVTVSRLGYGDMGEIKAQSAAKLCQSGGIYKRKGHLVIKIRGLGRKVLGLSVCKAVSTQSGIGICCS